MRFANSVLNGLSHKNVHINFHYFMLLIHFKDGLVFFLIKTWFRNKLILVKMILTVYTVCADLLLAVCSGFHLLSAVGHRGLNHLCLPPKLPKSGFSVETVTAYPFQPQVIHQDVALVVAVIPILYKNILQRVICEDHHTYLKRDKFSVKFPCLVF